MTKPFEFFFDFGSPATYLAYRRLPDLAARTGATVTYTPILLGGLFKAVGNAPPATVPNKGKWLFDDLSRWAKKYDTPFAFNPHFPVNTLPLMRGVCAIQKDEPDRFHAFCEACFEGMWVKPANLNEMAEIGKLLGAHGFDAAALSARIGDPEVKDILKTNTARAADLGLFGAPSFLVDGQLFWGQDRMDFVEAALTAA